jgi:phosphoserine phosphatase
MVKINSYHKNLVTFDCDKTLLPIFFVILTLRKIADTEVFLACTPLI